MYGPIDSFKNLVKAMGFPRDTFIQFNFSGLMAPLAHLLRTLEGEKGGKKEKEGKKTLVCLKVRW